MPVAGKEWMEPWVDQLYAEGITTGCGAGPIFCPEASVTRAAWRSSCCVHWKAHPTLPPAATHTFADMPVTGKEWMEPWVDEFYSRGHHHRLRNRSVDLLPGESALRAAAMAVFIDRAYGLYP